MMNIINSKYSCISIINLYYILAYIQQEQTTKLLKSLYKTHTVLQFRLHFYYHHQQNEHVLCNNKTNAISKRSNITRVLKRIEGSQSGKATGSW